MRKFIHTVLIISLCISVMQSGFAQDTAHIHHLREELLSAKNDTSRVNALRKLGIVFKNSSPDSNFFYTRKGLALAENISWTKGIAACCLNLANCFSTIAQYDSAIDYSNKALVAANKVGNKDRLSLIYNNRGNYYLRRFQYVEAMNDFQHAEQLAMQTGNKNRLGYAQLSFGFLYLGQQNYNAALSYYQKALKIFTELKDTEQVANAEGTIGSIYLQMKRYKEAEPLFLDAIQKEIAIEDYLRITENYSDLGTIYLEQNKIQDAILTINRAVSYAEQYGDPLQISTAYQTLGDAYLQKDFFSEAIGAYQKGLAIDTFGNLTEEDANNHIGLSKALYAAGQYKKAYENLDSAFKLSDTFSHEITKKNLLDLQTQYETEKKEKENQLLKAENAVSIFELQRNRAWLIAAGIAILLLIVLYRSYQLRQRARLQMVRDKISRDLHDDIGASLSSIRMYSESVRSRAKEKLPETDSILEKISDNSKEVVEHMSDIVWAINSKNDSLHNMEERMRSFAIEICASRNISVTFDFDNGGVKVPMDIRKNIFLIFKEAVNNAVKYSGCTALYVQLKKINRTLNLEVNDDGVGFDLKEIKLGNGIHNMQQRAQEIKATMSINGTSGKGTAIRVNVHLPKFGDMKAV